MRKLLTLGLAALYCCFPNVTTCRGAAPAGVLGINAKMEDGWLTIAAVHENYPASREGLRAGDRITSIDGQSTRNKSLEECLQRLAGAAGEKIVLTIARGSHNAQPFEATLVRQSRSHLPTERREPVQWKGNKILTVVPSDLSEATGQIAGALRVDTEIPWFLNMLNCQKAWEITKVFNTNETLLAAARNAVGHGAVVSWFHYPKAYPGLLRPRFLYWAQEGASLGFADRFLTDPPGLHPVEIEAGLSGTAPQAAGLAALIRSVNPELTPQQVEELMVRNATPIGSGVLVPDAHKAVLAARGKIAHGVNVDYKRKIAEVMVELPDGRIVLSLNPLINLVIHSMNMYDLLGLHGKGYTLKNDLRARQATDARIYKRIGGQERYFGGGSLEIYTPTLKSIISAKRYQEYPEEKLLALISPPPFDVALKTTWNGFYRSYWEENFARLLDDFRQMNERMNWESSLQEMETYTGTRWSGEMLIFPVEATAQSALKWGDNVCIGTLGRNQNAGFVHEGLHLLLKGRWAQDPQIRSFMSERDFRDKFWGTMWEYKYEQALVVALDMHIRRQILHEQYMALTEGHPEVKAKMPTYEDFMRRNFEGSLVGDVFDVAWPLVTAHVAHPQEPFERLMLKLIVKNENKTAPSAGASGRQAKPR